ncbi:hypothetical protein BDZ45DRAFT_751704 [Acephala macrosclerotiorum]|nr:hypothetical protein BDZ45DRAFT_751704 [Acephala macrosclerotiorum]
MDPLTAFPVAGTVIRFVDYSTKLFLGAHELYKSTSGVLTANQELELVTTDLRGVIRKPGSLTVGSSTIVSADEKGAQESFTKICDEVTRLATEMMTKLEQLGVREDLKGRQRAWASLFKAVESAWSKDELHKMRPKLNSLKDVMETRLLFFLCEKFDFMTFKMSERFDTLDRQTQYIISALVENRKIAANRFSYDALEQTATLSQLLSRLELRNQQEHQKTRAMIVGCPGQEIVPSTETLEVPRNEEAEIRKLVGNKILESLRYAAMSQRFDKVSEAHQKAFNWIFDETTEQQALWTNFADWLQNREGLYWLKWKAGSGKSTLMKYIFEGPRTLHLLRGWAADAPLCVSSFFFWNSGTWEQKSQQGLLRALLFQGFNDNPDLIPIVLTLTAYKRVMELRLLKDRFRLLVKQGLVPLKLWFFIDGLDEFEGDHDEMAELFKDITSSTVKMCLSSRPWIVFEESFQNCPGLRLQDLTRSDIELYIQEILAASAPFQRLATKDPSLTTTFVQEIVEKTDETPFPISKIDSRLPQELEPLYDHLLEHIEPGYYPWASRAFQILKMSRERRQLLHIGPEIEKDGGVSFIPRVRPEGPESLSILDLHLAMNEDLELAAVQKWTSKEVRGICEDMAFQLTARCAGLLETWHSGDLTPESGAHYLHRTAQDYLAKRNVWDDLLSHTTGQTFNPDVALLRSYVLLLGINRSHPTKAANWPYKSAHYALVYAHFAEKEPVKAPTSLLDDLDTIMSAYAKSSLRLQFSHWSNDVTKPRELEPATSFTPVAAIYGLVSYVQDRGSAYKTHGSSAIMPLLHYTIPAGCSERYFSPPQPQMVELLLKIKADVNLIYNSKTAWQAALSYVQGQQERADP